MHINFSLKLVMYHIVLKISRKYWNTFMTFEDMFEKYINIYIHILTFFSHSDKKN